MHVDEHDCDILIARFTVINQQTRTDFNEKRVRNQSRFVQKQNKTKTKANQKETKSKKKNRGPHHLVKALPSLARFNVLVSASTLFLGLGGFVFDEPLAIAPLL